MMEVKTPKGDDEVIALWCLCHPELVSGSFEFSINYQLKTFVLFTNHNIDDPSLHINKFLYFFPFDP
ncbi:MAG: hypothetical protein QG669_218 [Patescibacteria group bacterium]|nr:hypothetical protein [Patescibacteria group bacterium]